MSLAQRTKLGLVGTGLFGTGLADRLLSSGYSVSVFNRTRAKADPLLARGAKWCDQPLDECDRVIFCLFTTEQVSQFIQNAQQHLCPGQIFIDTSTSDPRQAVELGRQLAEQGAHYLEAPFSGSSEQARNGQTTAMVAGSKAAFDQCCDLWKCLAAATFYLGDWGNAAKMKLATNLVLGLNRAALAEGLAFADAAGLTKESALDVLLNSPAYSRAMDAKGSKMVEGDFAPQARLSQHLKDIRLMLEEAARNGASLPLSTAHLQLLEQAEALGLGDLDNCAIIRAIQATKRS
jgi:3-hydroxyisobutyrate dehydrogenase-like beta-hydroxyacid dehydrogenase